MVRSWSSFSSAAWRNRADITRKSRPAISDTRNEQGCEGEQRGCAPQPQEPHRHPHCRQQGDAPAAGRRPLHGPGIGPLKGSLDDDRGQDAPGLPQEHGGTDAAAQEKGRAPPHLRPVPPTSRLPAWPGAAPPGSPMRAHQPPAGERMVPIRELMLGCPIPIPS